MSNAAPFGRDRVHEDGDGRTPSSKPVLPFWSGRLRPAAPGDLSNLLSLLQHPNVRRFLCDDTVVAASDVVALLDESARLDSMGLGHWIIEGHCGCFTGFVGLTPVTQAGLEETDAVGGVEPIIALRPERHGNGLSLQVLVAILRYATTLDPHMGLVATVDRLNLPSHRLMLSAGFKAVGARPGRAGELVLYKHDWRNVA